MTYTVRYARLVILEAEIEITDKDRKAAKGDLGADWCESDVDIAHWKADNLNDDGELSLFHEGESPNEVLRPMPGSTIKEIRDYPEIWSIKEE